MKSAPVSSLTRRDFLRSKTAGLIALPFAGSLKSHADETKAQVVLVKTEDRKRAVSAVLDAMSFNQPAGRRVVIKPNFNTADAAPGSTHNETLSQLILDLRGRGGENILIGESSGPPSTASVLQQKGIPELASELKVGVVNFEELTDDDWIHLNPEGGHWPQGFSLPRMIVESEYLVSACCLKTHGFGGVFTMALKLAVGLTLKPIRGGMHALRDTHMRRMIAELNLGHEPDLIFLDGVEAFTEGGPSRGTLRKADVSIGGTDRIAVDAVGLAVLKHLGSNDAVMGRKIFEQEQISRAVELGLGVSSPSQIEIIAPDKADREYAERIREILASES